jgi:(R,R)-butanediol dehydrogenase/meso-butanediol dehydrogenase/diacetyl reductase
MITIVLGCVVAQATRRTGCMEEDWDTVRAAVFQGLGCRLEICDLPDPRPGPEDLVVGVARCGICGSDLHMTQDATFGLAAGSVLGHEFAGEVLAMGRNVTGFTVGDRICVPPMQGCGHCPACMAGEPGHCPEMVLIGGGYGELAKVLARQAVRMPEGVSMADGALVEPLAVALHGIRKSSLKPGGNVVVLGAGPIGLATSFWARRMGAAKVLVTDLASWQEERAMAMGATHFLSGEGEHVAQAEALLGGKADIVFECVGVPGLIAQAIDHVRPKGEVVVQGLCTRPDNFVPFRAIMKEVRIQFSNFFRLAEYHASLDVLGSGAAEPRLLITDTIVLDDVPDTFEALRKRTHQCKVQIRY